MARRGAVENRGGLNRARIRHSPRDASCVITHNPGGISQVVLTSLALPSVAGCGMYQPMRMTHQMMADSGILRVTVTGPFVLETAQGTFLEVLELVKQHTAKKVLIDGLKVKGEPQVLERFLYGEFAAMAVADFRRFKADWTPKFAYVLQEPALDPRRFGETVAVNRGMRMKAVETEEEALEWLGDKPSKAAAG